MDEKRTVPKHNENRHAQKNNLGLGFVILKKKTKILSYLKITAAC